MSATITSMQLLAITDMRSDKDNYYLKIAETVASRSTCLRRKYGAVLVKDDRIVSTGFSGAPRGRANCCDLGNCRRQELKIPSGERYELCRSVHAEMNAVIFAGYELAKGSTLYLCGLENDGSFTKYAEPCSMCKRVILNSQIERVVVRTSGKDKELNPEDWVINDDSIGFHEGY